MRTINNSLLRLAITIQARLRSQNRRESALELPAHSWQCCCDLTRQIRRAQLRGWHRAASKLKRDLSCSLQSVQQQLTALKESMHAGNRSSVTSAGEVYNDLVAIEEEFEELDFDVGSARLSVTTSPIVL